MNTPLTACIYALPVTDVRSGPQVLCVSIIIGAATQQYFTVVASAQQQYNTWWLLVLQNTAVFHQYTSGANRCNIHNYYYSCIVQVSSVHFLNVENGHERSTTVSFCPNLFTPTHCRMVYCKKRNTLH